MKSSQPRPNPSRPNQIRPGFTAQQPSRCSSIRSSPKTLSMSAMQLSTTSTPAQLPRHFYSSLKRKLRKASVCTQPKPSRIGLYRDHIGLVSAESDSASGRDSYLMPVKTTKNELITHPYQLDDITTVAYIEGNGNPCPKLLIIQYNLASKRRVRFIILVPVKLVYSNNAVPWRYSTEESQTPQIIKETIAHEITKIARVRGMMWSGRIFAPKALRSKDPTPEKRERIVEPPKIMVTEEEAHEFLKII
ncbi:hypothetical protein CR513_05186, partial [Mucuna pruriens]